MPDTTFLDWPFFTDAHRKLAAELGSWCAKHIAAEEDHTPAQVDTACRTLAKLLGDAGWLGYTVPKAYGGKLDALDVRSLCLAREHLAYHSGLADFVFALQGLGAGPITLFGSEAMKKKFLPEVAKGKHIAAFAISEANAGSDVAAMQTTARRDGNGYIINGEKTWISNAGIAEHYVVFCRFPEGGEKSFIALLVEAGNPGLNISRRIDIIAPHPLGTIVLNDCKVAADAVIGEPGKGLGVALGTLDVFRSTVGAAALGFARRALDESITHTSARQAFGKPLAEFQMTQARIADMATAIDASALLVYRAAWTRDHGAPRITREAAMAKLHATESAQKVIDDAVQLLGGRGVVSGEPVERLYREIRALRIYEGTSEIQKIVIAGQVMAAHRR